jgi:hypothetical protein
MPRIVISYRRSDSAAMAGRIFDQLTTHYGDDAVFMDIANIPFGIDYRNHFRDTLEQTDVLIALIGSNWLGRNDAGAIRMREETDPVRIEIETALERKISIIPVLIDGAKMPDSSELPQSFSNFAYLNAGEVSSGRDFHTHVGRVIAAIDRIVTPAAAPAAGFIAQPPRIRPARTRTSSAASNYLFAQISSTEIVRYFPVPLVVLLVCHYVVVNLLNLNIIYLWFACALVPFVSGLALFWNSGRDAGPIVILALALGLAGDIAMTISEGLYSGDPILPQTRFEWFENLQFTAVIALSFIFGHFVARMTRAFLDRRLSKS